MVGKQQLSSPSGALFLLEKAVPTDNFYRRLKQALDLAFLYELVKPFYGKCGHQSIDPVIFFKLMLVGHLENLSSDRALIRHCQLRIDILFFLDHPLDQPLPWHSTLSRIRHRLPEKVFDSCFEYVLAQCTEAGLVDGHTQAVDSALVQANASLDSVKPRELAQWTLEQGEPALKENLEPVALPSTSIFVNPQPLTRNNRNLHSSTDSGARMASKPGKPFELYYLASMVVDTAHHVITHMQANLADEKDSRHLIALVERTATRLRRLGLPLCCVLADAGFGSGTNYAALEQRGIEAYIALAGAYTPVQAPFSYDAQADVYRCSHGAVLRNHGIRIQSGYGSHFYISKISVCKACPIRPSCCGKKLRKTLAVTMYRNFYERMQQRVESAKGKRMKKLRSSTVEPVFGSLLNYFGMRRSNARGQSAAHKRMVMSATAYNLKKWLSKKDAPKAITHVLTLHPQRPFCL